MFYSYLTKHETLFILSITLVSLFNLSINFKFSIYNLKCCLCYLDSELNIIHIFICVNSQLVNGYCVSNNGIITKMEKRPSVCVHILK